jgi:hypothetical protein
MFMEEPQKRTLFPSAAGILTIAASLSTLAVSVMLLQDVWMSSTYVIVHARQPLYASFVYFLAVGIFGVISFPFGLTSGIFFWVRKRKQYSIIGLSLITTCGILILLSFFIVDLPILLASLFGLPIFLPSVLAIIFIAVSKAEFN